MKLHEYQAKQILSDFGVPTPQGEVVSTPAGAKAVAERLGKPVVVKAQVLMGGRGKAGGIKLAQNPDEAAQAAESILGKRLISPQNPQGLIAEKVLVEEAVEIQHEYYIGITVDRTPQRNVLMVSKYGGMDIEEVAAQHPDAIATVAVDPLLGLTDYAAREILYAARIPQDHIRPLSAILHGLYRAYIAVDANLAEINPCAVLADGRIIAADAKMTIDENALYRQKRLAALHEESLEDPIEAEASRRGIAYVRLGGDIGIIGNGAGLVMCTVDEVARAGGRPANFLDIGGGAKADRVRQAVELVLMDPNVKGLLFNIFGGITRGDEVARGMLEAFETLNVQIPVVVRLAGTHAEEGRALLQGTPLIPAETMQEAAQKIVELARASA
ncbi:MAG: succinate--CoA ligase subunit beta [Armatimonadetes bacterium JP3_11]|jgi:succinyl-CoA synthetase beta subunit|nr:MAG: succinate--CoA ligase subunit beta [Armatimonadetes bacterium CP1_7O]OYT75946.1 MAG: succinate--CoA ligase subunit beta [Armatimonadetes bacterium JP3_11]RMH07914.1 MAG: ADP-forming succinate--CoA ligase subunit beta [Armatimonadota bacterium]